MSERTGDGRAGAVQVRWLLTLLVLGLAALGAGIAVGMWLGG